MNNKVKFLVACLMLCIGPNGKSFSTTPDGIDPGAPRSSSDFALSSCPAATDEPKRKMFTYRRNVGKCPQERYKALQEFAKRLPVFGCIFTAMGKTDELGRIDNAQEAFKSLEDKKQVIDAEAEAIDSPEKECRLVYFKYNERDVRNDIDGINKDIVNTLKKAIMDIHPDLRLYGFREHPNELAYALEGSIETFLKSLASSWDGTQIRSRESIIEYLLDHLRDGEKDNKIVWGDVSAGEEEHERERRRLEEQNKAGFERFSQPQPYPVSDKQVDQYSSIVLSYRPHLVGNKRLRATVKTFIQSSIAESDDWRVPVSYFKRLLQAVDFVCGSAEQQPSSATETSSKKNNEEEEGWEVLPDGLELVEEGWELVDLT